VSACRRVGVSAYRRVGLMGRARQIQRRPDL
jgi:hypothetical protein